MPSQAGAGSPTANGPAAQDASRQDERAVRAAVREALREHWGLRGELRPLQASAASHTWQAGSHVVKLARDEPSHFTAGLYASEAVERAGIATGAPLRTRAGELSVALPLGRESWVLAVLRRVDGTHLSMHAVPPAVLGELLGRLHRILRACPVTGAWTPDDVLGHMTRGITAAQPPSIRQLITQAVADVTSYYATTPPAQLLYGDGPGIFSANGADISAIIDWGGVRAGSTADDIGCWTAHGATDKIPLPAYTAAFLDGYRRCGDLPAAAVAAVPLFQRLRIASRALLRHRLRRPRRHQGMQPGGRREGPGEHADLVPGHGRKPATPPVPQRPVQEQRRGWPWQGRKHQAGQGEFRQNRDDMVHTTIMHSVA